MISPPSAYALIERKAVRGGLASFLVKQALANHAWWLKSKPTPPLTTFCFCKAVAFRPTSPTRTHLCWTSCALAWPVTHQPCQSPRLSRSYRHSSPCSLMSATYFRTRLLHPHCHHSIPNRRSAVVLRP